MIAAAVEPGSPSTPAGEAAAGYWRAIARIVESRSNEVPALTAHGLGPLAAELLERPDRALPEPFRRQQRRARLAGVTAPGVLARVREACDGPLLVLKGPEVAARYPGQARAFGDVDLLVPDAPAVQRGLLASGFVEVTDPDGRWVGIQHLNPLALPGTPLVVEVHSTPKWPDGLRPPPVDELLERAIPSASGVPGVYAPAPADQAVLLAAHAWAHQPLGKARDLVDVGAFRVDSRPDDLTRLAHEWGVAPLWRTTAAAIDAFLDGRTTWPLRLWATHVVELRDQTVLETHLERICSPFWGLPAGRASRQSAAALAAEFRPAFDEGWAEKLRRTAVALRRPFVSVKAHRHMLGDSARRGRGRNTPTDEDAA